MKKGTVQLLAGATVVVAAAAVIVHWQRGRSTAPASTEEPLLPALEERINDVARIVVTGQDEPFAVERVDGDWVVPDRGGYPAKVETVRQLLLELRGSRRVERKTSNPERFEQLGLLDPDEEGATSRRVELLDAEGEEIADVVVGQRRFGRGAPGRPTRTDDEYYVRVAGEDSAWLATGKLLVETNDVRWLDQQIADLERGSVDAVRVRHADGEEVTLVKATEDAQEFELVGLPEGREPKTPGATRTYADALSFLRFDDVRPAEEITFPEPPEAVAELWTEDGLKVTVESVSVDDTVWARFDAEAAADDRPTVPAADVGPPPPPAPEDDGDAEADAGAETEDDAEDDAVALAARARELRDRLDGWAYALPSWKHATFRARWDDVSQVPEPEEDAAEEEEDPTAADGDAPPAGNGDDTSRPPTEEGGDGG